jgi:hypothetical protein
VNVIYKRGLRKNDIAGYRPPIRFNVWSTDIEILAATGKHVDSTNDVMVYENSALKESNESLISKR